MIHKIKVMHIEATITYNKESNLVDIVFKNENKERGFYNPNSFSKEDMVILDKLIFKCHRWLLAQELQESVPL